MPETGGGGSPAAARLEAVRAELRARGYLDSPLQRFLLRDVLRRQISRARTVFSLAVRVGLLGGPLVGLPVAAATFMVAEGQGGWTGFMLLALLLSTAFGLVLGVLEFLTALVLTMPWLQRTPGRASRLAARTAVVVSGLGVVYLALWWRARRAELGAAGWLDFLSLLLITVLALGLVRLTAVAGTLLVAQAAAAGKAPGPARSRGRLLPLTLALAAAASAVVFLRWPEPAAPPPVVVRSPVAGRLLVLGIDGLGAAGVEMVQRRRLMPELADLMSSAAIRHLAPASGSSPPAVWTTYATGRDPAGHGVEGVQWHSLAGVPAPRQAGALVTALAQTADALLPLGRRLARPRPVSALIRRAPAVWEILAEEGMPVAVSHWWATSPLPDLPGCQASDRAFFLLQAGGDVAADIRPAAAARSWRARFPGWRAAVEPEVYASAGGRHQAGRAMLADRFHADHFFDCLAARAPGAGFLYVWSVDVVRSAAGQGLPDLLAGAEQLNASALLVDGIIGRMRKAMQEDDRLILILDPGRSGRGGDGLLVASGRGVAAGDGEALIEATRVMPTLLWLVGFPVPSRPAAGPVTNLLTPAAGRLLPVRTVSGFGLPARPAMDEKSSQEAETREYLRSLGYIE